MGVTRYKKTVECNCGCNYGSNCGKRITFLLAHNRTCDVYGLFVNEDAGNPESEYKELIHLNDTTLSALIEVLTANTPIEQLDSKDKSAL